MSKTGKDSGNYYPMDTFITGIKRIFLFALPGRKDTRENREKLSGYHHKFFRYEQCIHEEW